MNSMLRGPRGVVSSVLSCLLCLAGGALGSSEEALTPVARLAAADLEWSRRAEGANGELAAPGPVEQAIAGYRRVLTDNPDAVESRWRLVRALHFRGRFCAARAEKRRRWFEEARGVAEDGVRRLDSVAAPGEARLQALRRVPGSASLYLWAAVAWGEWALARGKLAAVMQGAAVKVRDLTRISVDIDPAIEHGGGYRILGRLHDDCPRIPFITGWVSHQAALDYLRAAVAIAPDNSVNTLFLAEAILRHDPERKQEARQLLERCAAMSPHPEYLVEDRHFSARARRRLEGLRR